MEPTEQFQIMVERDFSEISVLWKVISILCYLSAAISGYLGSIAFYTFWHDICGGNCPLWATVSLIHQSHVDVKHEVNASFRRGFKVLPHEFDWTEDVVIKFERPFHCDLYFFLTLFSCIFGITWVMYFSICGRGGYDNVSMYNRRPWKIVIFALIFDLIFIIVAMVITSDLKAGYVKFSKQLHDISSQVIGNHNFTQYKRSCDSIEVLLTHHNINKYSICKLLSVMQTLSWIMICSWVGAFVTLLLRVIFMVDFRLLKIKIYDVPENVLPIEIMQKIKKNQEGTKN